ncbi:hypothetical protein F5B17DRAFT_153838 [Nemania serpens]|nr:hypothetical protein F5B17DRAFT_153838 [Nemania serpens]
MSRAHWQDLRCAVEKSDIMEHYGDPRFPMQLRMLAEIIIGRGFAGNDGTPMRQMMMVVEGGDGGDFAPGDAVSSAVVDMSSGNFSTLHRQPLV